LTESSPQLDRASDPLPVPIQSSTIDQVTENDRFNPFGLTKVRPHGDSPLISVSDG